jgi:hypothetical protein
LDDYLKQVEAASAAGLYYLSLAGALMVPDMCAALGAQDGRTSRVKYTAWFDSYAATKFTAFGECFLTGEECYGLRCSMLHQAGLDPSRGRYSRVWFIEPGSTDSIVMHLNQTRGALNIDVQIFVTDVVAAARAWITTVSGTQPYETNAAKTMRRHLDGLSYIRDGPPVIG